MRKKFILIGLAMSGFAFSQTNCPNVEDISWVLGDENQKYVVSLLDSEIYSDELDVSVKRDTFLVNTNYPIYHLIDETEWEESDNCMNCDEID
jgi:hypothetical protein